MPTIPLDGREFWLNTAASIPSGWSRDTTEDGRFLQGVASTPGTQSGGSHVHVSPNHTHLQNSHFHTISDTGVASQSFKVSFPKFGITSIARTLHEHDDVMIPSTTAVNQNTAISWDASDAPPPFRQAIIIKPDDGNQEIPDDATVLSGDSVIPDGFTLLGSGDSNDMDNRFFRGATAAGNGGATGGSVDHDHDSDHGHDQTAHQHADTEVAAVSLNSSHNSGATAAANHDGHHQFDFNDTTPTNQETSLTTGTASNLPLFHYLYAIQNTSGGELPPPVGIMIPYVGTAAGIPKGEGWYLCDGNNGTPDLTDKQIQCTDDSGDLNTTGGNNSHSHSVAGSHGHLQDEHGHTFSTTAVGPSADVNPFSAIDASTLGHIHGGPEEANFVLTNETATNQTTSVTVNSSDGRSSYVEVLWIKYTGQAGIWIPVLGRKRRGR